MDTYQSSTILQSIRHIYIKRLFFPVIYFIILTALWLASPVSELVFPNKVSASVPFREISTGHFSYISTTLTNLHFTGYTQKILGYTNGYYYYTFQEDSCVLVLLAPATCEEGLPDIDQLRVRVRVIKNFDDYDALTLHLAQDLNWTASGLRSQVPDYLLSEPGFHKLASLLLSFYFLSGAYALADIFICTACLLFPVLSPTCRNLGLYGNAMELLSLAEEELAMLPQLEAEDIYITNHFFIAFADDRVAVVPISEIRWIYKHSTLHKFLWHPFNISYTLHITANKHLHLQCPENMKSDIDGIMDYLCEANHEILVGFNEKNRQQVQKMLGKPGWAAKIRSLFY